MYDKNEKNYTDDPKNREKDYLHSNKRKECYDTRYDKGENEKYHCYENRSKIEENHRKIELSRYSNMPDRK